MGKIIEFKSISEFNKAEKSIPWQYLIYRDQSILLDSIQMRGYSRRKYYKELFGFDYGWQNIKVIDNYFFFTISDNQLIQKIGEKVSFSQIRNFLQECYSLGEGLLDFSEEIKSKDLTNSSTAQLFNILKKYKELTELFSVYIIYPLYAYDIPYREKIKKFLEDSDVKNADEIIGVLTYPKKKNYNFFEQKDFLKLCISIKKNSNWKKLIIDQKLNEVANNYDLTKLINKHVDEYGWVQCRNYFGEPWTLSEMIGRINNSLQDCSLKAKELEELESKMKIEYQKQIKKIKPPKEIINLVDIAKELVYYRTFRTDVLHKSGFNFRNIFNEIGVRYGYKYSDLIHMTIEEILGLRNKKIPLKEINKRKRHYAFIMVNGKINVFWGKEADRFVKEIKEFKKRQERKTEIKGNIANPGLVKGRVSIVKVVSDLSKVKRGDVLVAPMTFPSFVPAMEKSCAFVTNEGGILCHAAIVSREMKKPCIIGTKNATEVLRDGDLVEVDANKGVIRIIN